MARCGTHIDAAKQLAAYRDKYLDNVLVLDAETLYIHVPADWESRRPDKVLMSRKLLEDAPDKLVQPRSETDGRPIAHGMSGTRSGYEDEFGAIVCLLDVEESELRSKSILRIKVGLAKSKMVMWAFRQTENGAWRAKSAVGGGDPTDAFEKVLVGIVCCPFVLKSKLFPGTDNVAHVHVVAVRDCGSPGWKITDGLTKCLRTAFAESFLQFGKVG